MSSIGKQSIHHIYYLCRGWGPPQYINILSPYSCYRDSLYYIFSGRSQLYNKRERKKVKTLIWLNNIMTNTKSEKGGRKHIIIKRERLRRQGIPIRLKGHIQIVMLLLCVYNHFLNVNSTSLLIYYIFKKKVSYIKSTPSLYICKQNALLFPTGFLLYFPIYILNADF